MDIGRYPLYPSYCERNEQGDVLKGFLPPDSADTILQVNRDYHNFGVKAPDRQGVEWAAKKARRKLTTFEEYIEQNPLKLE